MEACDRCAAAAPAAVDTGRALALFCRRHARCSTPVMEAAAGRLGRPHRRAVARVSRSLTIRPASAETLPATTTSPSAALVVARRSELLVHGAGGSCLVDAGAGGFQVLAYLVGYGSIAWLAPEGAARTKPPPCATLNHVSIRLENSKPGHCPDSSLNAHAASPTFD